MEPMTPRAIEPPSGSRAASAPGSRRPGRRAQPAESKTWLLWLGAVLAVTLVVYVPSLDNGFVNLDDTGYVTENIALAHPTFHNMVLEPYQGNYHPLTMLTLAWNYSISKLHPGSYHVFNLILHVANTALVFLFIRALAGGLWAPALTSLFFGIHPTHVESVAWISERKDVLYAFFYLAGLLLYLRYLDDKRWTWLAATLGAFFLSAASKPAAVTFPFALLAIDAYRGRRFNASLFLEKAPHFLLALVVGVLTVKAQRAGGAVVSVEAWGPWQRILFAAYGTAMYWVKAALPFGLAVLYLLPKRGAPLGPEFYVALAAVVILVPLAVFLFRRNRAVLFGLAFFFINIVLVLQFFTVGRALMADRYTYLPYIGLFFALTYWMDEGRSPFATQSSVKTWLAGGLLLLIPVCLVQTWQRANVWQDTGTLWSDVIQKYPGRHFDAYFLRGVYYHHEMGRADAAMADYNEALRINPNSPNALANKGTLLFDLGRTDSAFAFLDRALKIKPDIPGALNNRGAIRGQRGDIRGAIADFSAAIAAAPGFRDAYENRAVAYHMVGDQERAIADTRRALELDPQNPDNPALWDAIGQYEQALHRYGEAVAAHGEAIRRASYGDPRITGFYFNRSLAALAMGDRAAALRDAQEAERLGATLPKGYLQKLGAAENAGGTSGGQ